MDHEYNFGSWWNGNIPSRYGKLSAKFSRLAWFAHKPDSESFISWLRTITGELPDEVITLMLAAWNASTVAQEEPLPNRKMTASEDHALAREIVSVIAKYLPCDGHFSGYGPNCETCMRLHNAVFTDPACVDHG
jgi:hypothetical protein